MTLRNGREWLFFFGIFFPILLIFGAFARPAEATVMVRLEQSASDRDTRVLVSTW
jgi:hypothetical protein